MAVFPHDDFVTINPSSYAKDYLSEAQSLKVIGVSGGGQRWDFELKTSLSPLKKMRGVWMFLCAQREFQTFEIQIPIYDTANGDVTGDVRVASNINVGEDELTFVNYAPVAGDFIQCAGHSKVYGVVSAIGNTATIFPPLIESVGSNEAVMANNLRFTVRRVGTMQKIESKNGRLGQISFSIREAF